MTDISPVPDSEIRSLTCYEQQKDAQIISGNKWHWQLAKFVAKDPSDKIGTSNVIWSFSACSPRTTVSKQVDYALGWTASVPADGVAVTIGGNWQRCAKGESYDIGADGYWTPSVQSSGDDGWLCVGNVGYKYKDVPGIHIMVGLLNPNTKQYECIFVDTTTLPPNSSARYQPREKVVWWWAAENKTGQFYTGTKSHMGSQDYSAPASLTKKYEWWTTYTVESPAGEWTNSQTAPAQYLTAPPFSSFFLSAESRGPTEQQLQLATPEVSVYPIVRLVLFVQALSAAAEKIAKASLQAELTREYAKVSVEIISKEGSKFKVSYEDKRDPGHGTREQLGVMYLDISSSVAGPTPMDEPKDKALKAVQAEHDLPSDETWTFAAAS